MGEGREGGQEWWQAMLTSIVRWNRGGDTGRPWHCGVVDYSEVVDQVAIASYGYGLSSRLRG